MWHVELSDEGYEIIAPDDTSSGVVEYGEPALLQYLGKMYMALIPDQEDEYEGLGVKVWQLTEVPSEAEDVELEVEEEEDEEDEVPEEVPES
jgi:hypothetical protein